MSIILAITTDGRRNYLERTLDSIDTRLTGNIVERIIWDDSGDPTYQTWLADECQTRGYDCPRIGTARIGHAESRAWLWRYLTTRPHTHIAGWEDDFTLTRPINLDNLVAILDANPHLSQIALMRNACYPRELRTSDRILGWPRHKFRQFDGWYQHRQFWTCNPSVYSIDLCREGWPTVPSSEVVFADTQFAKGRWSAFHGHIDDEPAIEHIGLQRAEGWY